MSVGEHFERVAADCESLRTTDEAPVRRIGQLLPDRPVTGGYVKIATVLWEGAKAAFAYYLRNLARVAGLYGALEGVIVLALWLELSVSIILYCAEIVALLIAAPRPRHVIVPRRVAG